ncbi:MAG: glycosyltransferase family 2 protein, partial [bacterium]|nr:glycosyltransferase family 2 protein [bacterium]
MNKIILSLVIPSHNSSSTIANLLNSINNSHFRSFKQIEVIIVDDLSTDNTVRIISNLIPELKFTIVVIKSKSKIGPAKARNIGVSKANGKYILFLDSDVVLYINTLKIAYNIAQKGEIKAFTGIWNYKQHTHKFFPQFKALRDWSYWQLERKQNYRYYLFSTRIAGIEKKLFNTIGRFNEDYPEPTVEDIELTYKIEKVAPIKFVPTLEVKHEFEDFLPIAIKYFKRTRDWTNLYLKRYRFDPVATTKREASKPMVLNIFFLSLTIFLVFHLNILGFLSIIFFCLYLILELRFLIFLTQKKGIVFALQSIPVAILLYIIIEFGALYGFVSYYFHLRKPRGFMRVS